MQHPVDYVKFDGRAVKITSQSTSDRTGTSTACRVQGESPPEARVPQPDTLALVPASQSWPWIGIVTGWMALNYG